MCGICGVLALADSPPPEPDRIRAMIAELAHRGPDERGLLRDRRVGLGHTRLSIIDLSTGQQPLGNEDGSIWVVFNGEIFNYLELAAELRSRGHQFRTRSDTEVIVHQYEEDGLACFTRFNGQWAIALWDRRRQRLLLSRDRLGVRPLYYTVHAGLLRFASEVKALFSDGDLPRQLDLEALAQVLTFWCPLPPRSPFAGVRQLRPGHTLVVDLAAKGGVALDQSDLREQPYWQPRFPAAGSYSLEDLSEAAIANRAVELRSLLEQAVRLRLRADVPVGVYLSGGIDSSVIAALTREVVGDEYLRTFSVRFTDPAFDESRYQQAMVGQLGTDHSDVLCAPADVARVFADVIWYAEAPLVRAAPAPLYTLSGLVRDSGYKVVLTGEGADEFLAGYDLFREARIRAFWARRPDSSRRPELLNRLYPWLARSPARAQAFARAFFARGLSAPEAPTFSHLPRWEAARGLWRLLAAETRARLGDYDPVAELVADLPSEMGCWEPLARAQYLEIRTLLSGYILSSQGDRMLMAHSVEGRFPFLDARVVEFANSLPPSLKLRVLDEKHLLKRCARDLVPEEIVRRPKQPYRAPDAQSFVAPGAPEYVGVLLGRDAVSAAGIFDPDGVARLHDKCRRQRDETPSNADNMALVGVLSTQLVHHLFVRGHGFAGRRAEPAAAGAAAAQPVAGQEIHTVVDLLAPPPS